MYYLLFLIILSVAVADIHPPIHVDVVCCINNLFMSCCHFVVFYHPQYEHYVSIT